MSYAKVMASLNETSAASGVEVEVKKRTPDGSYIPADDRDFATADFDAELEAAVKAVQKLPRDERLAYGAAMRVEGNAQFERGDHADAIRTYAKAMAGLDLSSDREATLRSVALPLWANSAASPSTFARFATAPPLRTGQTPVTPPASRSGPSASSARSATIRRAS